MLLKLPAVYIITNKKNSVLYTGVTSDLKSRIYQHRNKLIKGFSEKYNCTKLVYYESFDDMLSAIAREKQIKAGSRNKKILLIKNMNIGWRDLYDKI
jgi:putative endonuclease